MIACGLRAASSLQGVSCGTISQYALSSRTRRAINWLYCAPKSKTRTVAGGTAPIFEAQEADACRRNRPGVTVAQLNRADRAAFTEAVGFVFENSPWIAERAWEDRPFENAGALHARMMEIVEAAPPNKRVELIAAHPDLAGRVAREGRLTPASQSEQQSAGLDTLSAEETARFERLNRAYRERFDFPFVICARENDKASILAALERRAQNDRETEIATALSEIAKIARLRLESAVGP